MAKNNKAVVLDGTNLSIDNIGLIVRNPNLRVKVSPQAHQQIQVSYEFLRKNLDKQIIYGINTGFGPMASHILASDQLEQLQLNLIRSHAVGMGNPISSDYVLASMVVRLNTLTKGLSAVSPELVTRLEQFINLRIIPVVPEHGAVGTSGDLVQLAHIALALVGEGEVFYSGKRQPTNKVLKELNIGPYTLKPKEGLALINGTGVMAGIASLLVLHAETAFNLSLTSGAVALELVAAFDESISLELNAARPHIGQLFAAERLRKLLRGSKLLRNRKQFFKNHKFKDDVEEIPRSVQETYSLRCLPQILGPIYDTIQIARARVTIEINSVTDNPIVSLKQKSFLHGGNFHGDYISLTMDTLKIAIVKMTMLSERRINFFLNQSVNKFLPPFLNLKKPGLTLALQGLQFVATSTTAHNQTLAYPQYVHSIPTNADNQDVVSMGTDAALIAARVIDNAFVVLAIETVTLTQAIDILKIHKDLSVSSSNLYKQVREILPKIVEDRVIYQQLDTLVAKLKQTGV